MPSHQVHPFRAMKLVAACALAIGLAVQARAEVKLPSVIGSHMVLQRDAALPIWGWADPGEQVTVHFRDQQAAATADDKGRWSVRLKPEQAGEPGNMIVEGSNKLVLEDVQVGEVWVCSGQSNMQWSVQQSLNPEAEIQAADYPQIRLFYVPRVPAASPQDDVSASWEACTPQTVERFSAVAYFFGRELHQELGVPVGLINTSWGGTRIEPWTPPAGFEQVASLKPVTAQLKQFDDQHAQQKQAAFDAGEPAPQHPLEKNHQLPTALYNGMVHALVPFAVRGAIWYQGESNRGEALAYHDKMKALIAGWREVWRQGEFPFLFVQLAPYRYAGNVPEALPEIWEAQQITLEKVPNTGMAVTTDIGNLADIHPKNKQEVGRRLALWALAGTYGKQDLVHSGPLYKSMRIEDGRARITFEHAVGGLKTNDGQPLSWFTIAGADGNFVEAQAGIEGDAVVVWSDRVAEPKAVRFGWHQEAEPNLVNSAGLPASPFRTDRPKLKPDSDS